MSLAEGTSIVLRVVKAIVALILAVVAVLAAVLVLLVVVQRIAREAPFPRADEHVHGLAIEVRHLNFDGARHVHWNRWRLSTLFLLFVNVLGARHVRHRIQRLYTPVRRSTGLFDLLFRGLEPLVFLASASPHRLKPWKVSPESSPHVWAWSGPPIL